MAWRCRFLAARPVHPTHWLISTQVLTALKSTGKARAPRYDKTAFGGFGDRAGLVDVEGADVVLVEGWMAGFKPVASRVDGAEGVTVASTAPRGSRSHRRRSAPPPRRPSTRTWAPSTPA